MTDENTTDTNGQAGQGASHDNIQVAMMADLRESFSTELTSTGSISAPQIQKLLELLDSGSMTAADVLKVFRDSSATSAPAANE